MKKNLREWLLRQDSDAESRLDALRARVLAPGLSIAEVGLALFRPTRAWAALALVWIALLVANHVANREPRVAHVIGLTAASASLASLLPNEAPAPLDHHS
jgi:hypothetical protein